MSEERANLALLEQLPEDLKMEVLHYAEYLQNKYAAQMRKKSHRRVGSAQGKYTLAPDFDAPLEDFKEYM